MSLPAAFTAPELREKLILIVESHRRLLGHDLVPLSIDPIRALWEAPQAIVAHGTQTDPIFFFGNRTALERFEMTPDAFAAMPSRLSAEPLLREERQALLDAVARHGFITDYAGIRISASGKRFRIEQAIVWNLIDADGTLHGQAACFDRWEDLPG